MYDSHNDRKRCFAMLAQRAMDGSPTVLGDAPAAALQRSRAHSPYVAVHHVRSRWLCAWALGFCTLVSLNAHAANTSRMVIGTTPAQIAAQFRTVINANLARSGGAARFAKLSNVELVALKSHYLAADLVPALDMYAPTVVPRYKGLFPVPTSTSIFDTLENIYLDFRTAPVGSLSAPAALLSTAAYAVTALSAAGYTGYEIGSALAPLIEKYDPSLYSAIGDDVGAVVNLAYSFSASGSAYGQGEAEWHLDLTFGVPLSSLSYPGGIGDWGVLDDISYVDSNFCINPGDC